MIRVIDGEEVTISSDCKLIRELCEANKPCILILDDTNMQEDTSYARYACTLDDGEEVSEDYLKLVVARFNDVPLKLIETDRLVIRELCARDSAPLAEILSEDSSSFFSETFASKEDARDALKSYAPMTYDIYGYGIYGVCLDGRLIGTCGFTPRENGDIELGYAIDKRYRKMGYGFEACKALIEYAKNNIEYNRIIINTAADNEAGRALKKKLEGIING